VGCGAGESDGPTGPARQDHEQSHDVPVFPLCRDQVANARKRIARLPAGRPSKSSKIAACWPERGRRLSWPTSFRAASARAWGWFVDPTPWDDSEFSTPGNQGEQNRMDLLTALMHEMGHVLGYEHEATGVMQDTLAAGVRESPNGSQPALLPDDATEWIFALLSLEPKSKDHPI
jgi:hypothetical protein